MNIQTQKYLVLGDIHSMGHLLQPYHDQSVRDNTHVILLGDLIDRGNNPALMFDLLMSLKSKGLIHVVIMGNHDMKLMKYLHGAKVQLKHGAQQTAKFFEDHPAYRDFFIDLMMDSYLIYRKDNNVFVHGAWPRERMNVGSVKFLDIVDKNAVHRGVRGAEQICLFGYTDGFSKTEDGFPVRLDDWIDDIPAGMKVYRGHVYDYGVVTEIVGKNGGVCYNCDTGSGHVGGVLTGTIVECEA